MLPCMSYNTNSTNKSLNRMLWTLVYLIKQPLQKLSSKPKQRFSLSLSGIDPVMWMQCTSFRYRKSWGSLEWSLVKNTQYIVGLTVHSQSRVLTGDHTESRKVVYCDIINRLHWMSLESLPQYHPGLHRGWWWCIMHGALWQMQGGYILVSNYSLL